jgi:hypothetical protein
VHVLIIQNIIVLLIILKDGVGLWISKELTLLHSHIPVKMYVSKQRIISLYPSTDLAQFHGTIHVFGFFGSFTILTIFFLISNFFELITNEETWLVKMRIWCIKIGIVLVLHVILIYIHVYFKRERERCITPYICNNLLPCKLPSKYLTIYCPVLSQYLTIYCPVNIWQFIAK